MYRLVLLLFSAVFFACPHPKVAKQKQNMVGYEQVVLVKTPDAKSTMGELQRFQSMAGEGFKPVGKKVTVSLGRSGLAWGKGIHSEQSGQQKKEGDGKAPAGIFHLIQVFGYEPPLDLELGVPFVRANESLECVDDSWSKFYNQTIDNQSVQKDWSSSEFMRREDHQYKWGVVVNHNPQAIPQAGSCIFLHIWKEPGAPTSGCTAMAETDLLNIIHWLDKKKNPVLIQLTEAQYKKWKKNQLIPDLG